MRKYIIIISALFASIFGFAACKQGETAPTESGNAVIEAIMSRRSIRKYLDKPVSRDLLQQIAVCGVNAPNGSNSQLWEVRIVDNQQTIADISDKFKTENPDMVKRDPDFKNMFRNAPAVICIAVPQDRDGVDAGLMGENMILAAQSLGLGTVCLGGPVNFLRNSPSAADFMQKLGLSDGYKLLYMIAVGYPDETPEARPRDLTKIKFVD